MIKKILKIFRQNSSYLAIIVILISIMAVIMRSSLHNIIISFDYKIIANVKLILRDSFTSFFKMFTNFGDIYIPVIILLCVLIFVKNKWKFILLFSSYLFAGIVTYAAKLLAARPRPIEALIDIPKSFSFPSGHTITSFVFYITLVYLLTYNLKRNMRRALLYISIIFSFIIAFSRIYLGVHYFSDVMGGLIIAIPCLIIVINTINRNFNHKLKN